MSKRHGATSIGEFKEEGFLPEALLNYITLLGWSPKDDREILSLDQLKESFNLEGVNPSNPIFDKEKLEWMNGEYIRSYDNEKLLDLILPFLSKENLIDAETAKQKREWLIGFVSLLKERCKTLKEFAEKGKYFFTFDYQYDPSAVKKHFNSPEAAERLKAFADRLSGLDEFKKEKIEEVLRYLSDELQIKSSVLIHLVRLAATGVTGGPPLFDLLELLGKEEVVKRIKKAIEFIQARIS
jgi:glutamyl-tRNA synthetase